MKLEIYDPKARAADVLKLWDRALGKDYPVSDRAFWQNTIGNPFYEHGDAFVAVGKGKVLGFALAKLERSSNPEHEKHGSVGVLMVDPAARRKGIGKALLARTEDRVKGFGCAECGVATPAHYRFWPGIPTELTPAYEFFAGQGYKLHRGCFDLVRDVSNFRVPKRVKEAIAREGVEIRPLKEDEVADLLTFERAEFKGWEPSMRSLIGHREADHIIIVKRGGRIIGSLQSFSPLSRMRSANLIWETLLGADCGGLGAVGIAKAERGKDLGLALCAVATDVLRRRGVRNAHIDWTGLIEFYGKLGYKPWREYWKGEKKLA
ncbi:MAG TPA: GNAT family N-acetyltransferase [Candidatus Brocadiia bacterium]|nr:GNAT family N-acetyltransferase [Candidatus Brocadiia bacterium]